jgi:hypothetical protein
MKQEKKKSPIGKLNGFLIFFGIIILVAPSIRSQDITPTYITSSDIPKIFIAEPEFDFGIVDEGPDLIHYFKIYNKGKSVLKIKNETQWTDATITRPKFKINFEILPGRYLLFKTMYHTNGRPGHATKIIPLSTNDPNDPKIKLQLDVTVVREIGVQPDRVYLYNIKLGQSHDTTVKIIGKPNLHLKILSVDSAQKVITTTSLAPFKNQENHQNGASFHVFLPATQPIGPFSDEIVVKTNDSKKPEIRIEVLGEVAN